MIQIDTGISWEGHPESTKKMPHGIRAALEYSVSRESIPLVQRNRLHMLRPIHYDLHAQLPVVFRHRCTRFDKLL